jgi:4-amino-4-deoxy-L-arabinose transferase-like glycosyltransferase
MDVRQQLSASNPLTRIESILLFLIVMLGFILRAWQLSSVGLNHFDEGVYVLSALGLSDPSQPHRLYPGQIHFSPPAFLGLVGLGYTAFGGPSDTAAILINVLLGTLTIPIVWWVGRSWFGAPAGVAAAAMLSLSYFHIEMSRTALTDVAFTLFFLIALGTTTFAFERKTVWAAIAAGLAVGLAWNTKYHGPLALFVSGAALLPFAWYCRERGLPWKRYFFLWGIIAAVACFCYIPWGLYIQSQPGGHVGLLQYYARFASRNPLQSLLSQVQSQLFFEGILSRASIPFAFLCTLLVVHQIVPRDPFGKTAGTLPLHRQLSSVQSRVASPQPLRERVGALVSGWDGQLTSRFVLVLIFLSTAGLLIGGSGTMALLALVAIPALLRRPLSYPSWLVMVWLAVFFFSTLFYRPYARLVLPFTVATCLVAGFWISTIVSETKARVSVLAWRPVVSAIAGVAVLMVAALLPGQNDPWRPSLSVREAAIAMETIIPQGSRVLVIGEPELAFYLQVAKRPAFEQTELPEQWDRLNAPVYFITGVYADRAPVVRDGLAKLGDRLVPLGTFRMIPNDIRLLDDFVPREAQLFRIHPDSTYDLSLYRLFPKPQSE